MIIKCSECGSRIQSGSDPFSRIETFGKSSGHWNLESVSYYCSPECFHVYIEKVRSERLERVMTPEEKQKDALLGWDRGGG